MFQVTLCIVATMVAFTAGAEEEKEAKQDAKPAYDVAALYRFYNIPRHEHIYTYGTGEPNRYRKDPNFKDEKIIGYVALKEEPGAERLWRAVRPDGMHYFFLEANRNAIKNASLEQFVVYVWKRKAPGRIPIHACWLPGNTDVMFDPDLDAIEKFTKGTEAGIGIKRHVKRRVFYVLKEPPEGAKVLTADAEEATDEIQAPSNK